MILHMDHNQWRYFYIKLNARLIETDGCRKKHNHTLKHTKEILASLKGIDVEETLNYFNEFGAYCDCNVIYYVFSNEPKPEKYFFKEKHRKKEKEKEMSLVELTLAQRRKESFKGSIRRYNW